MQNTKSKPFIVTNDKLRKDAFESLRYRVGFLQDQANKEVANEKISYLEVTDKNHFVFVTVDLKEDNCVDIVYTGLSMDAAAMARGNCSGKAITQIWQGGLFVEAF